MQQGWPSSLWSLNIHEGETFLVNYIYVQGNILNQSTCGRSTGLCLKMETVTVSVHARGFRHRINERTCTEQSNLTVYYLYYIQSLFWIMLYWGWLVFSSSFSFSSIESSLQWGKGERMPERTSGKTTWGIIREELCMKVFCIHCGWPHVAIDVLKLVCKISRIAF